MEERLESIVVTPEEELEVGNSDESVLRTVEGVSEQAEPIVGTEPQKQIVNTILVNEVKYLIAKAIKEIFPKLGFRTVTVDELPAVGENGVIYFVPNGGENPNAYDEYVWVSSTSEFEKVGSTELPLNYVTTDTDQTITGVKTFSNGIKITSGGSIDAGTTQYKVYNGNFSPTASSSLGTAFYKWSDLYLTGGINPNSNGYKLTFPNTTSWTADKEIATTDIFTPTSVSLSDGGTITDSTLKSLIQNEQPIKLNGFTCYFSCDDGTNYQYVSTRYDANANKNHINVITIDKSTWVATFHTSDIAV